MYWSGCQSTGAEMRKYLTRAALVENRNRAMQRAYLGGKEGTYGCRLAGAQRCCPAAGFAGRPGLVEMSRARQIVPEAAASGHGGGLDTCCAATRSSVQSVWEWGTSDVAGGMAGTRRKSGRKGSCQIRIMKGAASNEGKASTVSDTLNAIIKREGLPRSRAVSTSRRLAE